MAARFSDIVPLLLITILCVAVVEGGYQALDYFVLHPIAEQATIPDKAGNGVEEARDEGNQKKHDYRIITRRNLFGPPPGKSAPVQRKMVQKQETLESTSLNIILMGTIEGTDGTARAIILDQASRKQELYEAGDAIQGALVKEILRGKVVLTYNGQEEMLDMKEAVKVRSAYAAPVRKVPLRKQRSPIAKRLSTQVQADQADQMTSRPRARRRVISSSKRVRPSRSVSNGVGNQENNNGNEGE